MNSVRIRNISSFLLALAVSVACVKAEKEEASPSTSLKGFEIYSWQEEGQWCYALLTGTNRMKSLEEMTARETRLPGSSALKERLGKLARGEFVSWRIETIPGLAVPPEDVVDGIRTFCERRGLKPIF